MVCTFFHYIYFFRALNQNNYARTEPFGLDFMINSIKKPNSLILKQIGITIHNNEVHPKSWTKKLIKLLVNEFCTVQDSFLLTFDIFSHCCSNKYIRVIVL